MIDKLKEPDEKSPALQHGTRVHALAAAWVTKRLPDFTAWDGKEMLQYKTELAATIKSKKIPEELWRFEEEFAVLIKNKAQCEEMWNLDRQYEIVEGKAYNPRVVLRIKVDARYIDKKGTLYIVDHKTGKFNAEHALQRSLYALGGLIMYPDAKAVIANHWYLDAGTDAPERWAADQLPALKKFWADKTTAMLNDTSFAPNPTDKCKWCFCSKARGGPCVY